MSHLSHLLELIYDQIITSFAIVLCFYCCFTSFQSAFAVFLLSFAFPIAFFSAFLFQYQA